MGSRYIISGVQLGMILAFAKMNSIKEMTEMTELVDKILDKQFIGNTLDKDKDKIKWWSEIS